MKLIDRQTIGNFTFQQFTEVFDETSDYRECFCLEQGKDYLYYVNLHKDERIKILDFRSFAGLGELTEAQSTQRKKKYCAENGISEEEYAWKSVECKSFESRKDCLQPTWKLHKSTVAVIIQRLHELVK